LSETGWFFRTDDAALEAIVDPHIRAIKEEGVLATILARFGSPIVLARPPGRWPGGTSSLTRKLSSPAPSRRPMAFAARAKCAINRGVFAGASVRHFSYP
jgi:hypothetical protein